MTDNPMIPEKKLYANYIAWGVVYAVAGIVYGLSFSLGLYINVFLALLAAGIALKRFLFGASLAAINMVTSVVTLLIYCAFANNLSCEGNPLILGSFTPVLTFGLWLVLFICTKVGRVVRSKYAARTTQEDK